VARQGERHRPPVLGDTERHGLPQVGPPGAEPRPRPGARGQRVVVAHHDRRDRPARVAGGVHEHVEAPQRRGEVGAVAVERAGRPAGPEPQRQPPALGAPRGAPHPRRPLQPGHGQGAAEAPRRPGAGRPAEHGPQRGRRPARRARRGDRDHDGERQERRGVGQHGERDHRGEQQRDGAHAQAPPPWGPPGGLMGSRRAAGAVV
jgi:hypothetical protein